MILKHYPDFPVVKNNSLDTDMCESDWDGFSGYQAMKKCHSQEKWDDMKNQRHLTHKNQQITLGELQRDCFLSTLIDINKENVNFMEHGSGWGRLCLTFAGLVDNNVFEIIPKTYFCLAVEAEPTHYKWNKEHFDKYNINGNVIFAAVSNQNGSAYFNVGSHPQEYLNLYWRLVYF